MNSWKANLRQKSLTESLLVLVMSIEITKKITQITPAQKTNVFFLLSCHLLSLYKSYRGNENPLEPYTFFFVFGVSLRQIHWLKYMSHKWVFPKIGVSQNGWFIMENPIKMDDLGVSLFSERSKCLGRLGPCKGLGPSSPSISSTSPVERKLLDVGTLGCNL